MRSLEEREADLGIGFLVGEEPGVASGVLDRSPFVLVAPREHRPAGRAGARPPTLAEALAGPLVHFEDGVDLRRHLERALARRGGLAPVIELPSIDSILTFVAAGFGSSILAGLRAQRKLAEAAPGPRARTEPGSAGNPLVRGPSPPAVAGRVRVPGILLWERRGGGYPPVFGNVTVKVVPFPGFEATAIFAP